MSVEDDNAEILEVFLVEGRDSLAEAESILLGLEADLKSSGKLDIEAVNKAFRVFHSIKGTAGFLGLRHLVAVTHAAESLLDLLRSNKLKLTSDHINVLCRSMDFSVATLDVVEQDRSDASVADQASELVTVLKVAAEAKQPNPVGNLAKAAKAPTGNAPAPVAAPNPAPQAPRAEAPRPAPAPTAPTAPTAVATPTKAASMVVSSPAPVVQPPVTIPPPGSSSFSQLRACLEALKVTQSDATLGAAIDAVRAINSAAMSAQDYVIVGLTSEIGGLLATARASGRSLEPSDFHAMFDGLAVLEQIGAPEAGAPAESPVGVVAAAPAVAPPAPVPAPPAPVAATAANLREVEPEPPVAVEIAQPIDVEPPQDALPAVEVAGEPGVEAPVEPEIAEAEPAEVSAAASPAAARPERADKADKAASSEAQSIRVSLDKLDTLMDLVGELIIAENMVTHNEDLVGKELENFHKAVLQLNRITRSLQDMVMSVRMVPIRSTFRRMIRLVRDLSQQLKKPCELVLSGEDTEVDKTVVEAIADPLVHIVRNSLDHGLEMPDARVAKGKPEGGRVELSARHEGGEVWIVVQDDGKGLDRDAILRKAINQGLIDGDGSDMKDEAVWQLIFEPGFSTAAVLSDVSGRGVGMDVVRRNIESLKGRIDLYSELGKGTTITLRIPLTLAIIEGMQVRAGEAMFILPLLAIRESVRLTPDQLVTLPTGQTLVKVRGKFLPFIPLAGAFGGAVGGGAPVDLDAGIVVVVEYGNQAACLFVDEMIGQRQTVIKALPGYLGRVSGLSGCSILSNGDISLIVDVAALLSSVSS
jgi:two-component system chemotaxis sensor kinase CheA